ncbi:MAG: 2-oxoacid:acceptor oxidoreductase family protein [Candidatus Methylomirabilota bacterium]
MPADKVTNVIVAGLGGQGVLRAAETVAAVAFAAGLDVKKSEVHGMSQRGGSVMCDVRFGAEVWSPMVPPGEGDFLLVLAPDQVEVNRWRLRAGGTLIAPEAAAGVVLADKRSLNMALLGVFSRHLPFAAEAWTAAIRAQFSEKAAAANAAAFAAGRAAAHA